MFMNFSIPLKCEIYLRNRSILFRWFMFPDSFIWATSKTKFTVNDRADIYDFCEEIFAGSNRSIV